MAKVIIAIHGLRNKPPKELLAKWAKTSIEEGLKNAKTNIELPQIELAYWADILYDKPLSPEEKDEKSPYFLDEVYTPDSKDQDIKSHFIRLHLIKVFKLLIYKIFLKKNYKLRYPFMAKNFIHSNFRDLEVYFTEDCENNPKPDCVLKRSINQRLAKLLEKHHHDQIFLVAHSMGSIIAFDVLSFIATKTKINTLVTIGSPLGAPFVISRIAASSKIKNQEHIKLQTPEAVYRKWYNIAAIKDNITLDNSLADDFEANSSGVKVEDVLIHNTYKMNGISNPHKSFGYLRSDAFIKALIEFMEY
ncbi:MAG: hypothetical protein J7J72_02075 [Bacteroidales bacterium]|nr:hypothetical protein [Bacteroidales bacterium]